MLAKWPIVRRARYAKVYISLQRCRKMSFLEGDVHGWLGRAAKRGFDNKKAPNTGSFLNLNGGGGGIRTLVTGSTGETVFETAAFSRSAILPSYSFFPSQGYVSVTHLPF